MSQFSQIDEIVPHLYLTSGLAATELNVRDLNVRLVINATVELPYVNLGKNVDIVKIAVRDSDREQLINYFDQVSKLIDDRVSRNENVLVHCLAGVSRSASLCAAYLMKYQGYSLSRALIKLVDKRPVVRPNPGFLKQLADYEEIVNRSKTTNRPNDVSKTV